MSYFKQKQFTRMPCDHWNDQGTSNSILDFENHSKHSNEDIHIFLNLSLCHLRLVRGCIKDSSNIYMLMLISLFFTFHRLLQLRALFCTTNHCMKLIHIR